MGETIHSGLEVAPCTDPEVTAQPDANKYCVKAVERKEYSFDRPVQSGRSDAKNQSWSKAFWVLALIAVLCLAVALGAGLGVGLAAQHRSTPSSGGAAGSPVITTTQSGKVITMASVPSTLPTTQSGKVITMTSVPSTPPTTQPGKVLTITSIPSTPPTIPSPVCPADDRSTYHATKKPSPTVNPAVEIAYEIFCYTDFGADSSVMDLQTLTNVSSLHDCLEACALYSFQTKPIDFPAFACTGIAWARVAGATHFCWLKNNVTLSSVNQTDIYPGKDGAVMVFT